MSDKKIYIGYSILGQYFYYTGVKTNFTQNIGEAKVYKSQATLLRASETLTKKLLGAHPSKVELKIFYK